MADSADQTVSGEQRVHLSGQSQPQPQAASLTEKSLPGEVKQPQQAVAEDPPLTSLPSLKKKSPSGANAEGSSKKSPKPRKRSAVVSLQQQQQQQQQAPVSSVSAAEEEATTVGGGGDGIAALTSEELAQAGPKKAEDGSGAAAGGPSYAPRTIMNGMR